MARLVAVMSLCVAASMPAAAERSKASLVVSAHVPARAMLRTLQAPREVELSAVDLARGWKDVDVCYRVSSNSRDGYLLQFTPRGGVASAIEVDGLPAAVVVREESVDVHAEGLADGAELALRLRLRLKREALPGRHPLPLLLSVTPI